MTLSEPSSLGTLTIAAARTLGRDHGALRRNCQDSLAFDVMGGCALGVVADGCGSGPHSEVGAALSAATVAFALAAHLREGRGARTAVERALARLPRMLDAVAGVVVGGRGELARARRRGFAGAHLLSTAVGFAVDPEVTVVFGWGDGALLVDDDVTVLDQGDRPAYPGLALARGASLGEPPRPFLRAFETGTLRRVAVATDGFDPVLFDHVFGRSTPALARWLLRMQRQGFFTDDVSVIALERSR